MSEPIALLGTLTWPDPASADRAEFVLSSSSRWLASVLRRDGLHLHFRGRARATRTVREGIVDLFHREAGGAVGGRVQVRWGEAGADWVEARADLPALANLPPPVRAWVRPAVGLITEASEPLEPRLHPHLLAAYERLPEPRQRAALVVMAAGLEAAGLVRLYRLGTHLRGEGRVVRQARLAARVALDRLGVRG